ncbi:MAG: alpha/beta hydrolase [Candidatus Sulfotelmatobacter sp.]
MSISNTSRDVQHGILVAGSDMCLASYLVKHFIVSSVCHIVYLNSRNEQLSNEEYVAFISEHMGELPVQVISNRLRVLSTVDSPGHQCDLLACVPPIRTVWYLCGRLEPLVSQPEKAFRPVLEMLPGIGGVDFNLVRPACSGMDVEHEAVEYCRTNAICCRVFRTSLVVPDVDCFRYTKENDFLQFLTVLHELKTEAEERLAGYFDFYPLRYFAHPGSTINLIPAKTAVESMVSIAGTENSAGREFYIGSSENSSFADFAEAIGMVYDVSLVSVGDWHELSALDRAFAQRMPWFASYIQSCDKLPWRNTMPPRRGYVDGIVDVGILKSIRNAQEDLRVARNRRATEFPATVQSRTIHVNGFPLTYFVAGSHGTPIIIVNALGQGLQYWCRLIDVLSFRHRVIIWELRGILSPPYPSRFDDQVNDLDAIIVNEGFQTCLLVGWCTGPKIAIEYYLRHPEAISSMIFLNSTFKCLGESEDRRKLESAYERNMESLCRVVDKHPTMGRSIMQSLSDSVSIDNAALLEGNNEQELAKILMSLINSDLRPHVAGPFRSESATVNYIRQILDFWSYEVNGCAKHVKAPVLLVGAEYDRVALPEMSREAAKLFPNARYLCVESATHYCVYDRPEFVASLIDEFGEHPEAFIVTERPMGWPIQTQPPGSQDS